MMMSDREIAEDHARYIGQRSSLLARALQAFFAGRAPRSAEMFSELRPAEPEEPGVRAHSLLFFPSRSPLSFSFSFSFSCCALLFCETVFPSEYFAVAFRKGVLGPIISREYHYGYNAAPAWASLSRSSAYTDGLYECAERVVVAEERHKGNWRGSLKISARLDRDRR